MKRTRFAALASAVIAAALLTSTGTAKADGDNVVHLEGTAFVTSPCNSEVSSGPIDVTVVLNRHANGKSGGHVNAHVNLHGTLTGNLGNTYQFSTIANGKSDVVNAFFYDIPFHAQAAGLGSAPNFTFSGTVRVVVDANGNPTSAGIIAAAGTCSK